MEELKLILEVVREAGEGAYSIAIIYFIKEYLSMLLVFTGFMIPFILGYKFGIRTWKTYSYSLRICKLLDFEHPYYKSDWRSLVERLERMKTTEKDI